MVVGTGREADGAADEEEELLTGIALAHDPLACRHLLEAEAGVARHLQQLGTVHALEEGELQQLVVNLQTIVHASVLDDFIFQRGRVPYSEIAFAIGENQVGHQFLMALKNLLGTVHTQYHKRCGVGIGCGTFVG